MRYQHRVYCNTESQWIYHWNYSGDNLTECPNNSEHSIDSDNQTIIEKDDTPLNPADNVYFAQINSVNSFFELHTESMEMEDFLQSCVVDFFNSSRKLSSHSNILFDGQGIYLYGNGITSSTIEDFDSIIDWSEDTDYDDDIASIGLDTSEKQEGTGSLKITYSNASRFKIYGIKNVFSSSQDWSAYDCVGIYSKLSESNADYYFKLCLVDSNGSKFFTNPANLSSSWQETVFDFSACTFKTTVKEIRLYFFPNCNTNLSVNLDLLRVSKINTYQTSGNIVSDTVVLDDDINEIYFDVYADTPTDTSISSQISLDGGTTWHTLSDDEYGCWVDITQWSEYSSFVNLKNIVTKIILNSTTGEDTPLVDDYILQYKVKE